MFKLVKENDASLKEQTKEVDFNNIPEDLDLLSQKMLFFMKENDGMGLAVPQIGLDYRMFVISIVEKDLIVINPTIIEESGEIDVFEEGCLSFPDLYLNIKRPKNITVSYYNLDGENIIKEMGGLLCRCFQHEYDHLYGITFDTLVSSLRLSMARNKRIKQLKRLHRKKRS